MEIKTCEQFVLDLLTQTTKKLESSTEELISTKMRLKELESEMNSLKTVLNKKLKFTSSDEGITMDYVWKGWNDSVNEDYSVLCKYVTVGDNEVNEQ